VESSSLLESMHSCKTDVSGIKLVKSYSSIKEETEVLLKDRVHFSRPPVYELFHTGRSCICSASCMGFVVLNVYCFYFLLRVFLYIRYLFCLSYGSYCGVSCICCVCLLLRVFLYIRCRAEPTTAARAEGNIS